MLEVNMEDNNLETETELESFLRAENLSGLLPKFQGKQLWKRTNTYG